MAWKSTEKFMKFQGRRAERYSEIGRKFEQEEMEKILQNMIGKGLIAGFEIYSPHSVQDKEGKDIGVSKQGNGELIHRYFGITISMSAWHKAKIKHPDVPQFCFPIGTKPETIERRILELFEKD